MSIYRLTPLSLTYIYMNLLCVRLLRPEIKYLMPYVSFIILHWHRGVPTRADQIQALPNELRYTLRRATLHCGATLHPTGLRYTLRRATLYPAELRCNLLQGLHYILRRLRATLHPAELRCNLLQGLRYILKKASYTAPCGATLYPPGLYATPPKASYTTQRPTELSCTILN